ncbi:hypothetical protein [Aureimonas populi]|uniref:Phytase-like domain-containing protein n=1 Tax=Aureimonas populi TaxID=1701758 RepID=A0ABW5CPI2_9HYPH|nr:hypothetical protein [Aureimonas populi]
MTFRSSRLGAAMATLCIFSSSAALASSPDAWSQFRRDVEAACRAGSASLVREPQILVDPFGLQSYGLAILNGASVEDGSPVSMVCVYDKAQGSVEIGGTMAMDAAMAGRVPAPQPGEGAVAPAAATPAAPEQALASASARLLSPSSLAGGLEPVTPGAGAGMTGASPQTLDLLGEADRAELQGLPAQIERTIAANAGASLATGPAAARAAAGRAAAIAAGTQTGDLSLSEPLLGERSCRLYYFGYQNEAARSVGTHRCSVSQGDDGNLLVEKTSGERLRAGIRPFTPGVAAFVGRSFQPDHAERDYDPANPDNAASSEFGNAVGMAVQEEGIIYLISSQRRRFEESDSFFWVLAFDTP